VSTLTERGYLNQGYLETYGYLSGQIEQSAFCEVEMVLLDNEATVLTQTSMSIKDQRNLCTQTALRIVRSTENVLSQVDLKIADPADDPIVFLQTNMILGVAPTVKTETLMVLEDRDLVLTQTEMKTKGFENLNTEVQMRLSLQTPLLMEVKIGPLAHYLCGGYLNQPYLAKNYLAATFCAHQTSQVELLNDSTVSLLTETEMTIQDQDNLLIQTEMRIEDRLDPILMQTRMLLRELVSLFTEVDQRIVDQDDDFFLKSQVDLKITGNLEKLLSQVNQLKSEDLNTSVTMVIYNNTQMRLLCEFPSRGTPALNGMNWISVQPLSLGDFLASNLNTDIVEQRTQTASVALWQLRCNTGNPNTFVDTIAILNHNLSRGAVVEVSASDDANFSNIKFNFPMTVETGNMYYIAPTLPNIPAQYWQFTIQDNGNPEGLLKIGTIIFGSSIILTLKEQFLNPVTFGFRHFKDTLETEGFTSVSNDRALRRYLNLTFAQLIRDGGNFRSLRAYILDAKTDLKCLVIPRPTIPSALAVFSKLSQLPEEQHNAIDDNNWRVDMTFDWDESL